MSDDAGLTETTRKQILLLVSQLIEVSIWQDAKIKAKDPLKAQGDSFMTSKLKIVRDALES
mgnify:CR=1 FL=1|tara:strand:+ start:69 stop:251 length:183 start_codon:yes stop_codon:yes gene_type:complete